MAVDAKTAGRRSRRLGISETFLTDKGMVRRTTLPFTYRSHCDMDRGKEMRKGVQGFQKEKRKRREGHRRYRLILISNFCGL